MNDITKYPKTRYLSFSPSKDNIDVRETGLFDMNNFINKDLIITTKMDGSNLQMSQERLAARNGKYANHKSFDLAKVLYNDIYYKIPKDFIIFGEWLYAKHSIHYANLISYFQVFAIYDKSNNIYLSWQNVEQLTNSLNLNTVQKLGSIRSNNLTELEQLITQFGEHYINQGGEGIVVRNSESFSDFNNNVAKYVRKNHVTTDEHWSSQKLIRNMLK